MMTELEVAEKCIAYKVRVAARAVTRRYDEALRPVELRSTQFTLLTILAVFKRATMAELSDRLSMERTTLLRNLKPLEQRGFVHIEGDGRPSPMDVSISSLGEAKLREAIPLWEKAQAHLKQDLGANVFQTALETLEGFAKL